MTKHAPVGLFAGLLSLDVLSSTDFPIPRNKKFRGLPVTLDTGGPAANAARAFCALGGHTCLLSFGDTSPISKLLWAMYREENSAIYAHREEAIGDPTIANVLVAADTGERSILANGQPLAVNAELGFEVVDNIDIALLDGYYFKSFLPLLKQLRSSGTYLVLDGGSWKDDLEEHLDLIDCAILSNDFEVPTKEDPAKYLQDRGTKTVVITDGENSIKVFDGTEKWNVVPPKRKAIDTLGAGDMFHGAFCYYYSQRADLRSAVTSAARFASESVTHFGLRAFFDSRE